MILYISPVNVDENHTGVSKKIISQCRSLRKIDPNVILIYPSDEGIKSFSFVNKKENIIAREYNNATFYMHAVEFYKNNKNDINIIYARFPYPGKIMISYPLLLLGVNPNKTNVIVEIPTYPFVRESKTLKSKLLNIYSILFSYLLSYKIKSYFYMGEKVGRIWGTSAVRIFNSVNQQSIEFYPKNRRQPTTNIRFIAVAQLAAWHGYDRIIYGMSEYLKQEYNVNVEFVVIGDDLPGGNESKRLRGIVTDLELQGNVFFLGAKSGADLTLEFNKADIAVDSLGRHRSGNDYNCSLKSKEYAIRGFPFIKSHRDDSFDGKAFVYNCSSDDKPINIKDVINWYNNISYDSDSIHSFAKEKFNWDIQLAENLKSIIKE